MKIIDNVLIKVIDEDIENGCFIVSDDIVSIEEFAFYNCGSLKSIEIPNSVTVIKQNAFCNCKALTSVKLSNNLTSIEDNTFESCESLKSIEIPNSVTAIKADAFFGCKALTNIKLSNNLTSIEEFSFYNCESLKSIEIPDSVTVIEGGAFCNCKALTSVKLSNNLTSIEKKIFESCESLKNIEIPDSVTVIENDAFCYCTALTSVKLSNNLTSIGIHAFYGCDSLKIVDIPDSVTVIKNAAFCYCTALTSIKLSNNLTSIEKKVFESCESLKSIEIPDSVTVIKENVFSDCKALTSVKLSNNLTSIGIHAFYNCESLKSVDIPDSVTVIENAAFCYCMALTSIKLSNNLTSIKDNVFESCKLLTSIELPDSITSIESGAFLACNSLKNIEIPDSVTVIKESAFSGCKALTSVKLSNNLTSIGNAAFYNCESLKNIEIPDSVTIIKKEAFYNCAALTNIRLSNNLASIEARAFYNCRSLKSVTFPASLQTIGKNVFDNDRMITNCNNIETIHTPWGSVSFFTYVNSDMIVKNYLYLYANSILKEKYENIDEFYFDIITPLSQVISFENAILKFKNLFYKMRKTFDIHPHLFVNMGIETTEKFNLNTWNKIKNLFDYKSLEMAKSLSEMIEIFGLFESDKNKDQRINKYINLFRKDSFIVSENQYYNYLVNNNDRMADQIVASFESVQTRYLVLHENIEIPNEFSIYLTDKISEARLKRIKKLTGTYGKNIQDFIKENYRTDYIDEYKLKDSALESDDMDFLLFHTDLIGHINYSSLHRMFDGCKQEFNENFYNFLMENLVFILENEKLQSKIKDIQSSFDSMKVHYLYTSGQKTITLKQALDYLEKQVFDYHDGNYELAQDVKKAGVINQEAFNYYQEVFEKNNHRKLSSLIKRSNIYEIDGYTIKAELLRKDDSFSMLVGETNYTNCCQVFGGIGHNCMAHATNSDDGGIFITQLLDNDNWILLTQSWDWQNNNLYCHDNIEATQYFKDGTSRLKQAVAKVYELDGNYIIEKSKKEVETYIKTRRAIIEKTISKDKEEELEKLRELEQRQVIKLVTTGNGNDDLGLSHYFHQTIKVNSDIMIHNQTFTLKNFQPVDYNQTKVYFNKQEAAYTDSNQTQFIIAGSIEELCLSKLEPLVPIYRDDRRVIQEEKRDIKNYSIKKIKEIKKSVFPNGMLIHQESGIQDFEDNHIYLGEDWYLIYEEIDNHTVYISDLAKLNPELVDEASIQNKEMMDVIYDLVKKYDQIKADLKEDTSYLLFLANKKLEYLEQIGEDIAYPFNNSSNRKIVTEEEQVSILKQSKMIKEQGNPDNIMHHITFKKGRKLENMNLDNQYKK